MKKIFTLAIMCITALASQAQLNLTYISDLAYTESLNDIWGYAAPDGTEYALVGAANGTSIVSLADPYNPVQVAYVPGDNSTWRDIKTWGEFAYVTTDEGNDGLTIIDMSNLPNSVSTTYITSIPGVGTLNTCHNIYIDEFGYAYLAGCNLNGGGMLIFDCDADQANPPLAGLAPSEYSHDVYTLANRMYSSEIGNGQFVIYDVEDKSNITALGSQETPFAFTHNAWLSKDSTVLFTTDEQANAPIGAYDITDPTDIQELDTYVPFATLGDGVIPHNVHVWEDWLIVSYYTDGCILIDVSQPDNMIEVGNFDTYIPANTGFLGAWGAYPYLPSGLVLVSDIGNGLYVLEPNYVYACYLEGTVTDAVTGDPISAANVAIQTTPTFDQTNALGEFKTGLAVSGTYELLATRPGYQPETVSVDLSNGVTTTVDIQLQPLPSFAVSGMVIEAGSGNPIENAKVSLADDSGFFNYELTTDASGNFDISTFFEGEYAIAGGKWGYKTNLLDDQLIDETNPTIIIELEKGIEDIFTLDLGWNTSGNNWTGDWVREVSIGQFAGGGILLTPDEDLPDDQGNHCFITGNANDILEGVLINGNAVLTSPVFDLTTYNEPMMSYHQWYMNLDISGPGYPPPGDDPFIVTIDNGMESVTVDETTFSGDLYDIDWEFSGDINIATLIEPTDNMTVTFEANAELGFEIITEAAIDWFRVWDAMPTSVNENVNDIRINAYPNPSQDAFTLAYNLTELDANAQIKVTNLIGQTMEIIPLGNATDRVTFGAQLGAGIYFVQLENGTKASKTVKLIKQ